MNELRTVIKNLGFRLDPFAKTNADEEDFLQDYFIEPPFFGAVYGDFNAPKSSVVFAPRGGGKTALKKRIEIASKTNPFVCVTYNSFPTAGLKPADITIDYHLRNIIRLLLIAVVSIVADNGPEQLSDAERHILYLLVKHHLSDIDTTDLKTAISSVQNLSDKALAMWNKFTGPLGVALNALFTKLGLGTAEVKKLEEANGRLGQPAEQIEILGNLAIRFGYKSVYILVDKIDENALTGKASASSRFIQPLLSDLSVLELRRFAFKFFLWDKLADDYRAIARPDRVKYYELHWTNDQLVEMLSKRLKAHSDGKVSSLAEIADLEADADIDLDRLVVAFSGASPRNIIRVCKEICDQQSELSVQSTKLSRAAIIKGFDVFASNYSSESYFSVRKDLQKLKRSDFLVKHVYADVFKITQQAALPKIKTWQDSGAVEQIGTMQEKRGNRPSNHYAITNALLLKHIFSDVNVFDLWRRKVRFCTCGQMLLREWDVQPQYTCQACQLEVTEKGETRRQLG